MPYSERRRYGRAISAARRAWTDVDVIVLTVIASVAIGGIGLAATLELFV